MAPSHPWSAAMTFRPIEDAEMDIPPTLPFPDQLQRHAALLVRLAEALAENDKDKEAAKQANSLPDYLAAEESFKNVQKVLAPYSIARAKAISLMDQGYLLKEIKPEVCKASNECVPAEAIVVVFLFEGNRGLGPELKKVAGEAHQQQDDGSLSGDIKINGFNVSLFVRFLSHRPLDMATFGLLPGLRDAIIPISDTGELAQWIRDPGRRTEEIVKNVRDGALDAIGIGGKNNDLGRAIKDPINCTVGKLFGRCK